MVAHIQFTLLPLQGGREGGGSWIHWDHVLEAVDVWLEALKLEYESPNLWELLRQGHLPVLRADAQPASFTVDEVASAAQSLDEIAKQIRKRRRKLNLSKDQAEWLADEFVGLKRVVGSSDKKAFSYLIVGILVTASFQIAYDPERTRQLIDLAGQAFGWLLDLRHLLPAQ